MFGHQLVQCLVYTGGLVITGSVCKHVIYMITLDWNSLYCFCCHTDDTRPSQHMHCNAVTVCSPCPRLL